MEERKDLLQKTFHEVTPEEIDRKINEFGIDNNIKFTQTHVNYYLDSKTQLMVKIYDYVVFYLPKNIKQKEQINRQSKHNKNDSSQNYSSK